ncbi:MAG TPA: UvrD-helicase domain-containing protein [Longimicrobiales bacterium]|nr:UvrD-helicase domain-containing protein [Longimicrobiales bacterium]
MSERRMTAEQVAAILETRDALLVANAGTGKTTTVVAKILWLLGLDAGTDEAGDPIPPNPTPCRLSEIAAITFTEKAAHDLKQKLRERIGESAQAQQLRWEIDRASVGTIHAFCAALLREHALRLGIDATFRVLEEREARVEQERVLREVILRRLEEADQGVAALVQEYNLDRTARQKGAIGSARSALRDLRWHRSRYERWSRGGDLALPVLRELCAQWDDDDTARAQHCAALLRIAGAALAAWTDYQQRQNVRDFDSLVLDARELLLGPNGDAALAALRRRYRILIIDEFQDTDFAQRDIAFAISGRADGRKTDESAPQLFLVGDPKQSIYAFRGADIAVWNAVERELAPPLLLTRNFRSDPEVIDFVNAFAPIAMERTAEALTGDLERERVRYSMLEAGRASVPEGGVEWLAPVLPKGTREAGRRRLEAVLLARRIQELVGTMVVRDRDGATRALGRRDIAILYRSRSGLDVFEAELRRSGIPYYLTGQAGLTDRQEVADLVNALRVVNNPLDDLALFGFLRSPFVGLRDETLARIRMFGRGALISQSRQFLLEGGHAATGSIDEIEIEALRRGLDALRRGERLAHRMPLDDLLRTLMDLTGFREHLVFFDGHREAFSNIESFLRLAEEHRDLPLDTFLAIWDRWDETDAGLPQAQLYSSRDDVVTVTTFHSAKGLEWPVVFLIDTASPFQSKAAHEYWTDPELGPTLPLGKDERGLRDQRVVERRDARARAEDARLAYVAATRAMDRLIIVAPTDARNCYAEWLEVGRRTRGMEPRTEVPELQPTRTRPDVDLAWTKAIEPTRQSRRLAPIAAGRMRFISSATERMTRARNPIEWEQRYVHGIEPSWDFAREGGPGLPANVRGTIIHSVLERIRAREDLADILEESIGEVDAAEMQPLLAAGSEYRRLLAEEIERVLDHPDWSWYTRGEHHRELGFLYRTGRHEWLVGAFDLYRPDGPPGLIVDFKTHVIEAREATGKARDYAIQAEVYAEVSQGLRGPVDVRLHFTHPNVVVDMADVMREAQERRERAGRSDEQPPEQTDLFA